MPLGDSITWGSLSSTGNGYRKPLQDILLGSDGRIGVDVDFVGSRSHGSMSDSDNEGHSGSFLAEIRDYLELSIDVHPNLVLIHAGTNDMDLNRDVSTAIDRLESIIRGVAAGSPGVTICVARIIFSTDPNMQTRSRIYNDEISDLVDSLRGKNFKIVVADMSNILTTADLADKKHPNDSGYKKMAQAWNTAILEANALGFITTPKAPAQTTGVGLNGGLVENGACGESNWNDIGTIADLVRMYRDVGIVASGATNATADNVLFADINGGVPTRAPVFALKLILLNRRWTRRFSGSRRKRCSSGLLEQRADSRRHDWHQVEAHRTDCSRNGSWRTGSLCRHRWRQAR